mgnify:CR=1 FL=1
MNRRTMKKIIGLCCATFLLSGCHIYKSYDRPESIDATGIYRDPVAANDTLAANDTTNTVSYTHLTLPTTPYV